MPRTKTARDPKATEREVLELLEQLHAKNSGNGPEYAFMRQVRNAGGFDANRTFDAVAVSLWKSRGYEIHVYEVKCSRSDWQRELADPQKAEDAAKLADRFTVVGPRDVLLEAEVPSAWGLIHTFGGTEVIEDGEPLWKGAPIPQTRRVEGRKIRRVRAAPLLHEGHKTATQSVPRSFLIPMLRAAGALPDAETASERQILEAVSAAVSEARQKERERAAGERDRELERLRARDRVLDTFIRATGFYLNERNALSEGERVKAALAATPDLHGIQLSLKRTADELARDAERLRHKAAELGDTP